MYSQPSISRVPSVPQVANEEDQLEELRTRSAKKRRFDPVLGPYLFFFSFLFCLQLSCLFLQRTSTLARHRSIAESSQTLRQIEIPKKQNNKVGTAITAVILSRDLQSIAASCKRVVLKLYMEQDMNRLVWWQFYIPC